MADFKPYKVNSLPTSNIDVDGIYYVKTGNTFKAYIRNQADTDWVEQEGSLKYVNELPTSNYDVNAVYAVKSNDKQLLFFVRNDANTEWVTIPINNGGTTLEWTNVDFVTSEHYISLNGSILAPSTGNNWRTSDFIDVQEGDIFRYYGKTDVGSAARAVYGYDSQEAPIQLILGSLDATTESIEFTIPAGVSKIRACSYIVDVEFKLEKYIETQGVTTIIIQQGGEGGKIDLGKSYAAIGHSIWWQDGLSGYKGIQSFLKDNFIFTNYSKYSYSGNSLIDIVSSKMSNWVSHDIFTLDTITNDFKKNSPIGVQDDFLNRTGGSTFYGALRELHEELISLNPNYLLICSNALKRDNAGYTSWSSNTQNHTLTDYSEAMEWVANRLSWRFINQFRDSGIAEHNLSIFTSDGLHPNNDGYKRYAGLWIEEFKKIS